MLGVEFRAGTCSCGGAVSGYCGSNAASVMEYVLDTGRVALNGEECCLREIKILGRTQSVVLGKDLRLSSTSEI